MLATVSLQFKVNYARDLYITDRAISFGRVESNTVKSQICWCKWKDYASKLKNEQNQSVDCYLRNESFDNIICSVSGFAGRLQEGSLGRGNQISCPRVQTAVRTIGQTYELDLGHNPLYRAPKQYLMPLELMFAGFSWSDPIPVPEITISVAVPHQCACIGIQEGATPKETAMGGLCLISFFYLLRVGEYTPKKP